MKRFTGQNKKRQAYDVEIHLFLTHLQAKSILLWAMEYGGPPEKWAATQCLALSGVVTDKIIVELINQLHADNAVRTEKAGNLLAQLSQQSVRRSHLSYSH